MTFFSLIVKFSIFFSLTIREIQVQRLFFIISRLSNVSQSVNSRERVREKHLEVCEKREGKELSCCVYICRMAWYEEEEEATERLKNPK